MRGFKKFQYRALNSKHYTVPDMYADSLPSVYLRNPSRWFRWQSTTANTKVW